MKEGTKKQQPSSKCNFYGSVHATEDCATFANLPVDERVKKMSEEASYASSWAEAAFFSQYARQRADVDVERRRRVVPKKLRIDEVTVKPRSGNTSSFAASQLRRRRIDRKPWQPLASVTKLCGFKDGRIGGQGDSSHLPR